MNFNSARRGANDGDAPSTRRSGAYSLRLVEKTLHFGDTTVRFEPPYTCFVEYVGDLNAEVVGQVNAALLEATHGRKYVFLLVDLSRTGIVTDAARQLGMSGMRAMNPRATAVFGADIHRRVIATLITKAAGLLDVRQKGPVCFFAREREARAWLAHIQGDIARRSA